ncbi:MAG: DUF4910 domain-containing protein [Planctomycetota bacterium]
MIELLEQLYAIKGRSITGPGLRATLDAIGREVNGLGEWQRHSVRSGEALFDWTVPNEWTLRRATCVSDDGAMLADTDVHDLHVVNYSTPGRYEGTIGELADAGLIRSRADRPDDLPYVTSYYNAASAITLPANVVDAERDTRVTVEIDTTLEPGVMDFGELVLPGKSEDTVLFSAHCCHPQLANDNLASIAVLAALAETLTQWGELRHTYRFVFAPGTIGALGWLWRNQRRVDRIVAGLVLACAGDRGGLVYKRCRRPDAEGDRWLAEKGRRDGRLEVREFTPFDYDERQYNSPGFDLPIGRLTRSPNGEYPQYHTSGDDLSLVRESFMSDTLELLLAWVMELEESGAWRLEPTFGGEVGPLRVDGRGEPQLGKHGLYDAGVPMSAVLWCLNLADGHHPPAAMAERGGLSVEEIDAALGMLRERGLLV